MTLMYRLTKTVLVQHFDDGALLLDTATRRLITLNHSAYHVIRLTNGEYSVTQVAQALTALYDVAESVVHTDVHAFYALLAEHDLVEPATPVEAKDRIMSETMRYIRNPDVGLREESEQGALLFEPDSGQVKVINLTGLIIWKQCDGQHSVDEMIDAVLDTFEGAPRDEVAADVQNFLAVMLEAGFIGETEFKQEG